MHDEHEVRRLMGNGRLVPSDHAREFSLEVGPASRPPENGDIWILAGSPYVVSDVTGSGSSRTGHLRFLTEPLPAPKE